jgi:hypothetical protein
MLFQRTPRPAALIFASHCSTSSDIAIRPTFLFAFVKVCACKPRCLSRVDATGIRKGALSSRKCGSVESVDANEKVD